MLPESSELESILAAIAVLSPTSFSCAGATIDTKPDELISSLTDFLYIQCYARQFRGASVEEPPGGGSESALIESLRQAHTGRPCREFGWHVKQVLDGGEILARKGGVVRRFQPGHYLIQDTPFGGPQKDQRVAIFLPRDSTTVQPGYYQVFSEAVGESDTRNLVRFYWNVSAEGAPSLVKHVTRALGRFQVPYQLKLLSHREAYCRRDPAVLYVDRRYYRIAAAVLAGVHAEIGEDLRPETPLFTKRLARGLGLAEDPGESFGKHRSRILAQAFWRAYEENPGGAAERMVHVDREFRERKLSLDCPYLNPESTDEYEFPPAGL